MKTTFLLIALSLCLYGKAQTNFCGTDAVREVQLKTNPAYKLNEDIQNQKVYDYITSASALASKNLSTTYTIPVVFHIIHQNGPENVDDTTIINSLNELNLRFQNTAPYYDSTGHAVNIQFCLATVDPWGNPTTGITRDTSFLTYSATQPSSQVDKLIKNVNRWCPATYLNVWVVNYSGGVAYASFPAPNSSSYDGIVGPYIFLSGSVLSHEAGHYLSLYHTFDFACTNFNCLLDGDKVCDTPPDISNNYTLCAGNSCSTEMSDTSGFNPFTGDMDELPNYMDYTLCPLSFSQGQATRMEAALTQLRSSLLLSNGCGSNPGGALPVASFTIDSSFCAGTGTMAFHSTSTNSLYTAWDFDNDGRTDDVGDDVTHTFTTPGLYAVKMIVSGYGGSDSLVQTVRIYVNPYPTYPVLNTYSGISTDPVLHIKIACKGTIITLNGEPGMTSYQWSTGATTPSITFAIDSTLQIYLTVTDSTGRTISNCSPFIITVNPRLTLTILAGSDTVNCQDIVTLRLLPNPYWFPATNTWYDNGNLLSTNQFVLSNYGYATGNHTIWVANNIDPIGCVTNSDTVTFYVNAPPPLVISQQGNILTLPFRCLYTTWFKDGIALTINDSMLTVTANGCYSAACASCGSFYSDTVCITNVGLPENYFNNGITIYPNPFTSQTIISFSDEQTHTTISISNALGKEIKRVKFSGKQFMLDKEDMKSGIYFVSIENAQKFFVNKKIIVQ